MRILTIAAVVLFLGGVPACAEDDYASGVAAGEAAATESGDQINMPFDVLPEPSLSEQSNPAMRGSLWRQGYRDGYENGVQDNRQIYCANGLSPYPCR